MKNTPLVLVATLIALSAPARAQTGLFLGAQITGASLTYKDAAQQLDFGQGFGVHAGLTFGSTFGALVNYDQAALGSSSGDTDLGQFDVLGRLGFIGIGPVKTYLEGGITGRVAKTMLNGGTYDFNGTSPTAGIAASVFVGKKLSVDGSVLWTFGKFSDTGGYSASSVEATGSRVSLGASWYFLGGR